ncbi:MAG: hypothetical protein NXI01_00895 [Gammaproteobacteria bacterium]|nr:hypothetical protein [Gammaproteobacteria bacterium]
MKDMHLALRLPNWLGDVIMTLPTLEALSTSGFSFELFGKPWVKDLLSAYSYPIHTLPNTFLQARRIYQAQKITHCILLPNSLSSALHLAFSPTQSIGYRSNGRQWLLNQSLEKKPGLHEVEYFWTLAQFAVKKTLVRPKNPKLQIADHYLESAALLLKQQHLDNDFLLICPGAIGAGVHHSSKIWPHWQMLVKMLLKEGNTLVACPAPFELEAFQKKFGHDIHILDNVNLPLYAAIMQRAKRVIANDSGPMHLAAAVQAPVLGIFGQTNPQRSRPWGGEFMGDLNHWPNCEEVLNWIRNNATPPHE